MFEAVEGMLAEHADLESVFLRLTDPTAPPADDTGRDEDR